MDEFEFFNLSHYENLIIYHGDILIRPNDLKKFILTNGSSSITASNITKGSDNYPKTGHGYHLGLIKYEQPTDFIKNISNFISLYV